MINQFATFGESSYEGNPLLCGPRYIDLENGVTFSPLQEEVDTPHKYGNEDERCWDEERIALLQLKPLLNSTYYLQDLVEKVLGLKLKTVVNGEGLSAVAQQAK
ncbi:hypothetical protein Patl1_14676 [Pistacia atlantica]|uniref:Uncharacterized protein n=1 Tax=Pistacia atlantica TaxID=434234 RepID=A0ACC1ATY6_9ROSI|nr:hypothetical protein Patl1_14676 [Pistacia atlantica]